MKKKLAFIFVLALVLCMALLCIGAGATAGDGTIYINSVDQLKMIGADNIYYPLDGDYVLTANIELGGTNQWTPIGTSDDPFTGIFDGGNHTISGLYIDSSSEYAGLFGYVSGAGTVKNLTVSGSVTGSGNYTGGIVGWNNGTVSNCTNNANVTGNGAYTGGVVGLNSIGAVTNCDNTGTVSGGSFIGGVVGLNSIGAVTNCDNTGTVSGGNEIGGVVGYNGNPNGGATVTNCCNTGDVSGGTHTSGGVVGCNYSSVSNCYNTGAVSGSQCTGGVMGINAHSGTVESCYNTGAVTVTDSGSGSITYPCGGGVVGWNITGTVTNSYNTGAVTGGRYTGGVVGYNSSSISNCYNTGDVTGGGIRTGGVVGWNIEGTVENSYNTGTVSGGQYIGGVAGENGGTSTVSNCYYLTQGTLPGIGSGSGTDSDATPLSKEAFGDQKKYTNSSWDFTDTWIIFDAGGDDFARPMLKENMEDSAGSGTEDDPYLIPNRDTLEYYRDKINADSTGDGYRSAHYRLTANIELGGSETNQWKPIEGPNGEAFTGTFDGGNHTISGLYMNANSAGRQTQGLGLFSLLGSGGTIKNLTVEGEIDPENIAKKSVGGVAGKCNGGTISNCTSGVNIIGETQSTVGGVVGNAEVGSTVENCRYTGTINVKIKPVVYGMGGVVGQASGCTIRNCENAGIVQSNIITGGIVGRNDIGAKVLNCRNSGVVENPALGAGSGGIVGDNYGIIRDSYNASTGIVTGGDCTGGVAGHNVADSSGATCIVENCYNAGTVSGSGDVGGVVGHNNSSGNGNTAIVKNCYNTGTVSAVAQIADDGRGNVGGVVGVIESGSVNDCYNTGTVTGSEDGSNAGGVVGVVGTDRGSEYKSTVSNCYNTGDVTGSGGSSNVGGVVGSIVVGNYEVTNCYYLDTCGAGGSGTSKTASEFASGDVAWLLQDGQDDPVWGQQNLGAENSLPMLTSEESYSVIQVTFKESEEDTQPYVAYTNYNGTVTFPENPTPPEGQVFDGWYSGDTKYKSTTKFTEDTTLTAKFAEAPTYTVTVNGSYAEVTGAGSYLEGASVTVSAGERAGYRFAGWMAEGITLTDASAETVTFEMPASNVTLTASWDRISNPGNPTYKPIVEEPENGDVTTSPSRPEAGDTVTVNPEPDEGYEVDEIIVTDEDGNPVKITRNPDGSYSFTQPEGAVTIEVTFRPASGLPFTDVAEGDWFYGCVEYVYENGLMDGVSDTTFEPNGEVTRAQLVTILWRLDGEPVVNYLLSFTDVESGEWYTEAVRWAASEGIVEGVSDTEFAPNAPVTREQFAAILYRYAQYKGMDVVTLEENLNGFSDNSSISSYAVQAMNWSVGQGILTGVTDATLEPQSTATRAQCAAMLMRFVENVK